MKSSILITHENYEGSTSLTRRTRNSKKPSRMRVRSWKRRWLPLCLARQARHVSVGKPVARPMSSNQNLRVSWKSCESTRLRLEESLPNYREDHIAGKGTVHCNIKIWFINLFQCLSSENSCSESSGGQGVGKTGENFGVEPDESQK